MVSLDGVAPSRIVCVSASVNLPLHHNVQKFSSGTSSPGWSPKKGHKTVVAHKPVFTFAVIVCIPLLALVNYTAMSLLCTLLTWPLISSQCCL